MWNRTLNSADLITSVQLDRFVFQRLCISRHSFWNASGPTELRYNIRSLMKTFVFSKSPHVIGKTKIIVPLIGWLVATLLKMLFRQKIEEQRTPTAALRRAADGSWDVLRIHITSF